MSVVELPGDEQQRRSDDVIIEALERYGFDVIIVPFDRLGELAASPSVVAARIARAVKAVAAVAALDAALMTPDTTRALAVGVEGLRRQVDATATATAEHIDRAEPFTADGWFTAKRWLKHVLQLSGPEAHARVQAARFRSRVPAWADAQAEGRVGVAQCKVMAQIAANPRIDDDTLMAGALALLDDAISLRFDEFERLARTWEMLADPEGALDAAERARLRRDAFIRARPDGGWDLHAVLDEIGGAEFEQVLAWYIDAEFRTDWAEAVNRLGEGNVSMTDLVRREPQRRADALVAMARAAAAAPPDAKRPVPTVNVIIDAATLAAWTNRAGEQPTDTTTEPEPAAGPLASVDPARYRDVICRTERGHRVHPSHVVETTLWGHIRRVLIDAQSVIIDLGRRSRLFTGAARESVMLLEERCVWTGCDQPTTWCHADHLQGWTRTRGPTRPTNGAPLCPRHNSVKEQGFTVTRDPHGNWHVHAPDGHEIT